MELVLLFWPFPLCLWPPLLRPPPPDFGSCVAFDPAVCAIVAASSPAAVVPSSFRSGAFFVDCILICGGFEFDGKLLVDCNSLVMVPTALVRPSLNTSLWSQCKYSGVLMKRKWTEALSPVRKQSLFIDKMVAVCLMLPQWTMAWYLGDIVVG